MEIYSDGVVEFLYGYKDKESYSVKCQLKDIIESDTTLTAIQSSRPVIIKKIKMIIF